MSEKMFELSNNIIDGLYKEFAWLFKDDNKYIAMMKIVESSIDEFEKREVNK